MRHLLIFFFLIATICSNAQEANAFKSGEWFKFLISYGPINAGYATLEVNDAFIDSTPVYHVVGQGFTTGISKFFFKVEDNYESFFSKDELKPYRFIRQIDEGGHTKDIEINFDHLKEKAFVHNKKHNTKQTFEVSNGVQDMVSAFYYLRDTYKVDEIKVGDELKLDMFFDEETFPFKLKYLGKEVIRTKFGKIDCLIFRPYVMAGRVFKEEESLTLWVSNDQNKIPMRIKASLAVGSIKANLDAFKGLKHSFKVVVN
jgi:hypothetical protein